MRWKDREQDAIGVVKVDKIGRYMAAVAVKDQKSPSASCFRFRIAVEHLFEPGKPELVIRPS